MAGHILLVGQACSKGTWSEEDDDSLLPHRDQDPSSRYEESIAGFTVCSVVERPHQLCATLVSAAVVYSTTTVQSDQRSGPGTAQYVHRTGIRLATTYPFHERVTVYVTH